MDQVHTYRIEVQGRVEERELNAAAPLRVRVEGGGEGRSRLTAHTDQSGLVGLVRHLHGRGFVLLAVERADWHPEVGLRIPGEQREVRSE